jgi:outer membrane protein assembly factor BamD (BamD/ComL family)
MRLFPHARRRLIFLMAVLAPSVCLGQTTQSSDKKTWEYVSGQWPQVSELAPAPVSDPVIDRAEQYLAKGDSPAARQILLTWEHSHKDSPVRDRCVFLIAQSYYLDDDWILAFYYLDEVMDEYPASRLFAACLQKQYDIADGYLSGHKRRFFGFAILPAEDEAVEMMYRIQQRSPGSDLAERALLRTADYYYNSGQFDYAADTYAAYIRSYPRGKTVPRAHLREAFSNLAQFRGLRFDATPIIDARSQILDMERDYAKLSDDENLPAVVDRIDSAFAGKLYVTADYYERTGQPKAAVYFYRFLINTYGNSPEAAQARQRLTHMPKSALGPPYPPPSNGFAPATQPTADAR